MPDARRVIRLVDGRPRVVADDWCLVEGSEQWDACTCGQRPLLPLELARAQAQRAHRHSGWGLWLAPDDDPALAVEFFPHLSLIGVQFPTFTDGRGYSSAVLLRTRHGWRGELRALGDVLHDQLYALRRVGFDSFALRADRDPQAALRGFTPFSDAYQGSVDQPLPAFRRAGAAS